MESENSPIWRVVVGAEELLANHPPVITDRNKQVVYDVACPHGTPHSGEITCSRWEPMELPSRVLREANRPRLELRPEYFTYETPPEGRLDWHLNFAHYDLFRCYGGPLFAQDEMQVAEHPALAAVRELLLASHRTPYTVEDGRATPILIQGVERRCRVATDPNPSEGRPLGLYGNHFARADEEAIWSATEALDPPTVSHVIAIEAPAFGSGVYTRAQLEFILVNACTGFRSASIEATRRDSLRVAIHTGYWGCGAYGGNRRLMPLLQMIAACCAGVDALIFHTGGDDSGYRHAERRLDEWLPLGTEVDMSTLVSTIEAEGYEWGVGDGN